MRFLTEKLQYRVKKVKYLSYVVSQDGIACDPVRKVAISHIGNPKHKQDLQKLQGLINYVRNFVPKKKLVFFTGHLPTQTV